MTDNDTLRTIQDLVETIYPDQGDPTRPRGAYHSVVWQNYVRYLNRVLQEKGRIEGIPVYITHPTSPDQHPQMLRLGIGPRSPILRDWFMEPNRRKGGTEILTLGRQWWIMSWFFNRDMLSINVSHWVLHHDTQQQRYTIYFTRFFQFSEDPDAGYIVRDYTSIRNVPEPHRRRQIQIATEYLGDTKEPDHVLVVAPRGIFEEMNLLQGLVETLDTYDLTQGYLHRQLKVFILRKMVEYGLEIGTWRGEQISFDDGFLKDTWYAPNLKSTIDVDRFAERETAWNKVKAAYEWWRDRFSEALKYGDTDLSQPPEL